MAKRITGQNKAAAKFMGVPLSSFFDPGFCLLCGEAHCVCCAGSEGSWSDDDPDRPRSKKKAKGKTKPG